MKIQEWIFHSFRSGRTAIGFGCVLIYFVAKLTILGHIGQNTSTQTPLVKSKPGFGNFMIGPFIPLEAVEPLSEFVVLRQVNGRGYWRVSENYTWSGALVFRKHTSPALRRCMWKQVQAVKDIACRFQRRCWIIWSACWKIIVFEPLCWSRPRLWNVFARGGFPNSQKQIL